MEHRISAGALVVDDGKILLVRHNKPEAYDFWVAPGGGVIGDEDIFAAAVREVREEAGLRVDPLRIAYIEELTQPGLRHCKFWIHCRLLGGELATDEESTLREYIVDARFLSRDELAGKTVFPPVFDDTFWADLEDNFPRVKHLGLRQMAFY